ncbi:MAG TPA: 3D domain-containing protein [Candidatus Sulfopaludibacter sp.]|nr:3D domain-containing protein [Candidatus Sulfopaludibacter sp.]
MKKLLAILILCGAIPAAAHRPTRYRVTATAFCLHGITAAGTRSHVGTAAADPAFLPLGTLVRVRDAGIYSGTYLITDTGAKVNGRHIDLRLPTRHLAKQFGRRTVTVRVLKWGEGEVTYDADREALRRGEGM